MCDSAYSYYILRPSECSQEFYYYPFLVELDRYVGNCNSLKYLSNKVCVDASVRYVMYVKMTMFRNPVHVAVKMENISQVL